MSHLLPFNSKKGITVIEILVVTAVVGIALSSILGVATLALRQSADTSLEGRAQALAKETLEALLNYRDGVFWDADDPANEYDGLGVVLLDTSYYPFLSADAIPRWQLLEGEEQVENFTRSVSFSSVSRDASSNIVESGGIVDPDTKKVTARVSWSDRGEAREVTLLMYITNWKQP
ncbi:MAG: hypothetical protein A2842_02390 [Candidatus Wildermuthbacteria bacterium RIFCSPHIGHO2_01_FULL_48_25]|uniref:Type II secretion system protein n=1 Tax=Candidatus Wildermuthbacteria bacterium RIFCSPLOWO2_01_FULL_48_16 TaxID=1802461 RepID=A0A1G2RK28_9BACT|nr:MAG: hypothetical protein A2842_02390 [Candidatus Wildermuthbacteria bacterium RIFCSPHIGHO2_01_FULL_48_25]OHA69324.1 MAG: hypothetical protein A3J57_00330 [Candidatus Wildermuthbacteria bacterium RIFCSPHIGHO2_02_FULL_49_12b]OHA73213.1 MAG: hypothetical protein A3B24_01115 [Candidatus Wildermuthbacteria bacterium RIFCSPLOWO2_01_FULL_48_16]